MLPVRQKFGEFFRGQRSAEVVPLSLGAELGLQEGQLLLCFDTLGDYPLLETLANRDDGSDDDGFIGSAVNVMYE